MSSQELDKERQAVRSVVETEPHPGGSQESVWHILTPTQVAERLGVRPEVGLDQEEAERRLREHGPNELEEGHRKHPLLILAEQFTSPLVLVLIGAAVVSAFLAEWKDSVVISVILVLNGIIGFVQEYRADQAMAALRRLTVPRVRVRRGGTAMEVSSREVVPGDVVLLQAGDSVPADGRVLTAVNLRVEEAALTGESVPTEKTEAALDVAELGVAERRNMLFRGTHVVYGRGELLVTATGMATELGKIASVLGSAKPPPTPLQRRLAHVGKVLLMAALSLCGLVFLLGVMRGEEPREMFLVAVSLAVAAIPEGLPAVVTVALALGARRMAHRHAVVRSLPAVEGLGSVTVICSDKTGTLTLNEMTVVDIVADDQHLVVAETDGGGRLEFRDGSGAVVEPPEVVWEMLVAGALCNDARVKSDGQVVAGGRDFIGDPTEVALLVAAMQAGLNPEELSRKMPRVAEVPFDSERKRMTTVHQADGRAVVYAKGSPETLLPVCSFAHWDGVVQPLDQRLHADILGRVDELAARGRRVLAVARKELAPGAGTDPEQLEQNLTLLGLLGMIDPPRPEACAAVAECVSAGIRPIMITGDHKLTAEAISRELCLATKPGEVCTGAELDRMDGRELEERLTHTTVFARVAPHHKVAIVEALQRQGQVVAMTGDGVNDAPALKKADIGVSMGLVGTDVAREASDMVLTDDNFATIVAAVREGRVIYDNLRKFLRFMLTTNLAELLTIAIAMLLGWPVPLSALQILWINLVTDGAPALALSVEPPEKDVMSRPPRSPKESIFSGGMLWHIWVVGAAMAAYTLMAMHFGAQDLQTQRTIAFTVLAFAQVAHCMVVRSERRLIYQVGVLTNRPLVAAVASTVTAQLLVVYVPALREVFKTVALSGVELMLCLGVVVLVVLLVESEKLLRRYLESRSRYLSSTA